MNFSFYVVTNTDSFEFGIFCYKMVQKREVLWLDKSLCLCVGGVLVLSGL